VPLAGSKILRGVRVVIAKIFIYRSRFHSLAARGLCIKKKKI
jgi:hypothetical protein